MAASATKGGGFPLQKSFSRRVSFKESESSYDAESQISNVPRRRRCCSLCNACCVWASLIIGLLLLVLLIIAAIYFSFLQSNLPDVRLLRLDVYNVEYNNTNKKTLLTADFEVTLNISNAGGKMELRYSSMTASLLSSGVRFNDVKLENTNQEPHNTTVWKVRTGVWDKVVEEASAMEMQANSMLHMLVIDVVVKGDINFFGGGKKMHGFPFKIVCSSIDQSEIDNGHAPKCTTKMAALH